MINEASNVDYDKLARTGRKLRERLHNAKSIRVTSPGRTDLSFDLSGSARELQEWEHDCLEIRNRHE